MKISHYYPHSGGILGCHANVDFQHTNYLLHVTICEKLRCAHKLQTISDAFSHIASRFVKVALAIKFALNWLAGPQCSGGDSRKFLVPVIFGQNRLNTTSLLRHSRLTSYDLGPNFLTQGVELLLGEVWQVSKRNSQYFRSYLRKTTRGPLPPPQRGEG